MWRFLPMGEFIYAVTSLAKQSTVFKYLPINKTKKSAGPSGDDVPKYRQHLDCPPTGSMAVRFSDDDVMFVSMELNFRARRENRCERPRARRTALSLSLLIHKLLARATDHDGV